MSWLESIILGLIQGLTEFIPVSSSGHLVIAQIFLSGASDHTFLEFIDIGTTVALFVYFRHRIAKIFRDIFVARNYHLAVNILITAIPAGLVGIAITSLLDSSWFFGSLPVVAINLTIIGIIMIVLERLPKASPVAQLDQLSKKRALVIGLAQILSLIPGVSRSGSTIVAGRLAGFNAENAAEYSFLVSLPIMFTVCIKVIVFNHHYMITHWQTLLLSNAVAFAAGMVAIGFLMRYLMRHSLSVFGWYRVIVGATLIVASIIIAA